MIETTNTSKAPKAKSSHKPDVQPEYILLGFIIQEPMHGYDLQRKYTQHLGRVWHLSQSQLYAILKRLETRNLIRAVDEHLSSTRRIFATTELGVAHFAEWLEAPTDTNSRILRLEFTSRLFFVCQSGDSATLENIVQNQKAAIDRSLVNHEKMLAAIPDSDSFNRLSMQFRVCQLRCVKAWISDYVEPCLKEHGLGQKITSIFCPEDTLTD